MINISWQWKIKKQFRHFYVLRNDKIKLGNWCKRPLSEDDSFYWNQVNKEKTKNKNILFVAHRSAIHKGSTNLLSLLAHIGMMDWEYFLDEQWCVK